MLSVGICIPGNQIRGGAVRELFRAHVHERAQMMPRLRTFTFGHLHRTTVRDVFLEPNLTACCVYARYVKWA